MWMLSEYKCGGRVGRDVVIWIEVWRCGGQRYRCGGWVNLSVEVR